MIEQALIMEVLSDCLINNYYYDLIINSLLTTDFLLLCLCIIVMSLMQVTQTLMEYVVNTYAPH